MSRLFGVVLAVAGCGFELLDGVVQPFLMGRGEGPKLNADSVPAGPAYDGALDQDRGLFFMDIEQKIHRHSRDGSKGTFEPTSFAREIQGFTDSVEMTLVDEGAGKGRWKSGILSDHHNSALFCDLAAG
ncbi:MAG: hypothetical protein ABI980_12050 [Nitrospirota bacterium]